MRPILYQWDGEAMRPVGRMQALANEQYVPGERYVLELSNSRSQAEHRQYFAWLDKAWSNLPEYYENRWATPERLRKWALIQAGICHTTVHPKPTIEEAERFVQSMLVHDDELEIVREDCVVTVKRAKTQNFQEMTAAEFRDSKERVGRIVAMLIGVPLETLKRESQNHA